MVAQYHAVKQQEIKQDEGVICSQNSKSDLTVHNLIELFLRVGIINLFMYC